MATSSDGDEEEDLEMSRRDMEGDKRDNHGDDIPSKGYYGRFFQEERRLGMGAEGTVFLATHIIGGNVLGKLIWYLAGLC